MILLILGIWNRQILGMIDVMEFKHTLFMRSFRKFGMIFILVLFMCRGKLGNRSLDGHLSGSNPILNTIISITSN